MIIGPGLNVLSIKPPLDKTYLQRSAENSVAELRADINFCRENFW